MRVKGALHVHSVFSHDGSLTIAELAGFYAQHGYQFIAVGEHSQDMDLEKVRALKEQCGAVSHAGFLAVPGIEYTCNVPGLHILGIGSLKVAAVSEPVVAARIIRDENGFAVLAHPRRFSWACTPELLQEIDAVEIWNVAYDGKYLPAANAPAAFARMKASNPKLLAVASHDLHRVTSFYDVGIEMEVPALTRDAVLQSLQAGEFTIHSAYFRCGPRTEISRSRRVFLGICSRQLSCLRQARALAYRRSP